MRNERGRELGQWRICCDEPPTKPFTVFWALDTWMWYCVADSVEAEAIVLDAAVARRRIPGGSIVGVANGDWI